MVIYRAEDYSGRQDLHSTLAVLPPPGSQRTVVRETYPLSRQAKATVQGFLRPMSGLAHLLTSSFPPSHAVLYPDKTPTDHLPRHRGTSQDLIQRHHLPALRQFADAEDLPELPVALRYPREGHSEECYNLER